MAQCVVFESIQSGQGSLQSTSGRSFALWSSGQATYSAGEYSCSSGMYLVMSVAEVNAMPKTGVPDAVVMRDQFFLSFGLVLSCWLLGRMVGSVLHLIKGDRNDY